MKKKLFIILAFITIMAMLTACGKKEAEQTPIPQVTETPEVQAEKRDITDADRELINDTLQAVYEVYPGSAGCSLRTMIAAGKLLDLSESIKDEVDPTQLVQTAIDWAAENEEMEGVFDEAYMSVRELAFNYLENPDDYSGQLEDSGYVFTYDTHSYEYLLYVSNYLEISRAVPE